MSAAAAAQPTGPNGFNPVNKRLEVYDIFGAPEIGFQTGTRNPAGFSFAFAFAGRGKVLEGAFEPRLLGRADATGEENLAAHRCSNLL